jgi:hypothetical protein
LFPAEFSRARLTGRGKPAGLGDDYSGRRFRTNKRVDPGALERDGVRWTIVLLTTTVDGLHLAAGGHVFKAKRPPCPNGCLKPVWGHGWVYRYLATLADAVRLQRFRCSSCKTVITTQLAGFWPRFQTPVAEIAAVLATRLATRRWPVPAARQRAGHWLRRLVAFAAFESPGEDPQSLLLRLDRAGVRFLV